MLPVAKSTRREVVLLALWKKGLDRALDALWSAFSVFGVPIAIGVTSLIALFGWRSEYPVQGATPVEFRVLRQGAAALGPAQALAALGSRAPVAYRDTLLSGRPFWFSFTVPRLRAGERTEVELPSRHALAVACWDATDLVPLGAASRNGGSGSMRAAKAGFVIGLGRHDGEVALLCRARYAGPARISVVRWPESGFEVSVNKFHHDAGLLQGGLIVLSAFVLVTAAINREWLYVVFAAWLVASLRLGEISAGWDTQWLGHLVPEAWMFPMRTLTAAAYYVLTYTLFTKLFRDDLRQIGHAGLLRIARWSCLPLLIAAAFLPFSVYLPVLWVTAAVGIAILTFLLARILMVRRSRVAMWYSASLAVVLFFALYEVIAAALGARELIGEINSVTAAFLSSLLAALAIAQQMRQEHQARITAQARLRDTYEAIPIGLFTLDGQGEFLRVNPALTEMLGVDPARARAGRWEEHFEPGAWRRLQQVVREGGTHEIEVRGAAAGGTEAKWFFVKARASRRHVEGSLQDITERHEAIERLRFLAENDPLTGVLNRRGIEEGLDRATARLAHGEPLALAYVDLDRFKLINDLFGHVSGDEVLRQVAQRIREARGNGEGVGRIGGDEFVIVFAGVPMDRAAERCRAIVESIGGQPFQMGDKAFQVKCSIGLIEVAAGTLVKDAIAMADRACRAAKRGGCDGLVVYQSDAPVFQDRARELRLIEHLGAGVAPEGLFLLMQPIMSLRAPFQSLNFEVLIRMREPDGTVLGGGQVIAAAENNGRVAVIDRWVLARTLAWLDTHHARLGNTQFACINLSGASLNDEKFIQDAFAILAQHRRAAQRLCVEITESVALHDLENTKRFIERARNFGAKVALDDFGAGYTSFSYLKELPADAVKIDGSFVRGVNAHPANLAIVEAIVELARNLGMQSIAEWTEDRATVEALAQVGVDHVQGYVIARPQEPDRILLAPSSASFIEDAQLASFVQQVLGSGQVPPLWDLPEKPTPLELH